MVKDDQSDVVAFSQLIAKVRLSFAAPPRLHAWALALDTGGF